MLNHRAEELLVGETPGVATTQRGGATAHPQLCSQTPQGPGHRHCPHQALVHTEALRVAAGSSLGWAAPGWLCRGCRC